MHYASLLILLAAVVVAAPAHALTIYKCTNTDGNVAYQDSPCGTRARGHEFALRAEPPATHASVTQSVTPTQQTHSARSRGPATVGATRRIRTPVVSVQSDASWECRAANGDVFYQHAPCPAAVAGSVESRHAPSRGHSRTNSAAIAVTGRPVSRVEACRRIHAASASDRPGHDRDEDVSTYERNLGRDPCR